MDTATTETRRSGDAIRFWLPLGGLIALLVVLPVAISNIFDLDPRTPQNIAVDSLHDKYGLVQVNAAGEPVPSDSSADTLSQFSLEPGATTEDVPFLRKGRKVSCTIHAPNDDPASVTARCSGAD